VKVGQDNMAPCYRRSHKMLEFSFLDTNHPSNILTQAFHLFLYSGRLHDRAALIFVTHTLRLRSSKGDGQHWPKDCDIVEPCVAQSLSGGSSAV